MREKQIQEFAGFLVAHGVNLQKGQTLIINAPIECAGFVRLCADAAFAAGARDVVVHYSDEKISRIRMQNASVETLEEVKPWKLQSYMEYAQGEGGACVLSIYSRDPDLYKGIDSDKVNRGEVALEKAMRPWRALTMGDKIQWCVSTIPTESWAAKVLPDLPLEQAMDKLWQIVLSACRADTGNIEAAWREHVEKTGKHREALEQAELESLHLTSANGTDLVVGLADGHVWAGVQDNTVDGVPFLANIPTEEVFTAPHRLRTEGTVKSSMPYIYAGNRIEGITLRFEKGAVVEHSAERGGEILDKLLESDEGARHLGEIALVPASSPIRQSGLLFYNTLYDENAACHMALGAGYPGTVRGGTSMSAQELLDKGVNESLLHEDIMIGTDDMRITGKTKDGREILVFQNGEWALDETPK